MKILRTDRKPKATEALSESTLCDGQLEESLSVPRILQVISSTATRDGGPTRAATSINRALNALGLPALILTTNADGPRNQRQMTTECAVAADGVAMWACRRSRPLRIKNSWQLAHRVVKLSRSADVIHLHGVYEAHSIYAFVASRLSGVPYVLQPHGTLEPYQEAQGRVRKSIWNALVGHRIVNGAARIIAASTSEAANVTRRYPRTRCEVVSLGVDATFAPAAPEDLSHLVDWLSVPREKRLIFLGRLAKKKRPELVVQAWDKMARSDTTLLVVGPEQDWTHSQLQSLVSRREASHITFLGDAPQSVAAWLLSKAGVFVLPSDNENFGIAVAEAMSAGCAVVASSETAAMEHVLAGKGGQLIRDRRPASLASQLDALTGDAQLVRDYSSQAASYAATELSWDRAAYKLQQIYQAINEGPHVRSQRAVRLNATRWW